MARSTQQIAQSFLGSLTMQVAELTSRIEQLEEENADLKRRLPSAPTKPTKNIKLS
jgi:hypothetical protein